MTAQQPTTGPNVETIAAFEFLRAIGCAMVVVEHLFLPATWVDILHKDWCFSFGGLGIGIFTFVSGYLITRSLDTRTMTEYVASRFWRVYPTYIFVLFLALLIFRTTGYSRLVPTEEVAPFGFFAQALFVRDIFNMYNPLISADWTLLYEVQFYVVAGLSWMVYQQRRDLRFLVLTYLALTAALYLYYYYLSLTYLHGQAAMQRTGGSLFCFTGMLYYLHRVGQLKHSYWAVLLVWALGSVSFTLFSGKFYYDHLQVSVTQLMGMLIVAACLALDFPSRSRAPIAFVAAISFPLYLLHQTFGTVGFSKIIGLGWSVPLIADRAITFMAIVLPASVAIHLFVERPGMRLGSARRRRAASTAYNAA